MGMHALYNKQKGLLRLTLDTGRHVYGFINHTGLDPPSGNYACIYMSDKNAFICH